MAAITKQRSAPVAYYDCLQAEQVVGIEDFMSADPIAVWDDNGVGGQLTADSVQFLEQAIADALDAFRRDAATRQSSYGAQQAVDAIAEYMREAMIGYATIGGKAKLVLDPFSSTVEMRPVWDLETLLMTIRQQLEAAGDRPGLAALSAACTPHASLAQPPMPGEAVRAASLQRIAAQPTRQQPVQPRVFPRRT